MADCTHSIMGYSTIASGFESRQIKAAPSASFMWLFQGKFAEFIGRIIFEL